MGTGPPRPSARSVRTVGLVQQFRLGLRAHLTVPRLLTALAGLVALAATATILWRSGATEEVWVVAHPVPIGAPVTVDDLARVSVSIDHPFGEHVVDGPAPTGIAAVALAPGRPVLVGDVRPGPAAAPRTIAVPVDAAVVEALGLVAGDRVDLVAVAAHGDEAPRLVAADLRVSAVVGAEGPVRRAVPIVVEVSEADALAVADALERRSLVVVRSTGATS